MGRLVGLGDVGPTRGLEPAEDGSPLLETGSPAGVCASLGSSIWDTWSRVAQHRVPRLLHGDRAVYPRFWRRELLQEDGHSETYKSTFQRGWRPVCTAGLRIDKDMGDSWHGFGYILVGSKGSSRSCGREGVRAGVLSAPLRFGTLYQTGLIKTCFLQHRSLSNI